MDALVENAEFIISSSLSKSSKASYDKVIHDYSQFCAQKFKVHKFIPLNIGNVILYLSHLHIKGYSSSTIVSRLSSLNYFQKLSGYPDCSLHFLVSKFISGLNKVSPSVDSRIPITPEILHSLITSLHKVGNSRSCIVLYQSMMSLSFYAFLRPGEITSSNNNIMFHQVQVLPHKVSITFLKYKHCQGHPVTIEVNRQNRSPCPVHLVNDYIRSRGSAPGPFFCHPDLSPVSYNQYNKVFSEIQSFMVDNNKYHLHGLRIGAATYAALKGIPEETIRRMGRWNSNALNKYIRIPSFNVG